MSVWETYVLVINHIIVLTDFHMLSKGKTLCIEYTVMCCFVFPFIYKCFIYTFTACRKKKLVEGVCPTCEGTKGSRTYRCKLSVNRDNFSKDVTLR